MTLKESYFLNFGMELVKDKNLVQNVNISGKEYFNQPTAIGVISSIEYNNSLFLNIKNNTINLKKAAS